MGKTQAGAVWLDPEKTSPFDFYQYWRNVDDADVINCLRMLTFLPLEQINEMAEWQGSDINRAKEILAFELTSLVHSAEEAEAARETSRNLFSAGTAADMPTAVIDPAHLEDDALDILTLLVETGLCPSKSEARRAVDQGGVEAAGEKVSSCGTRFSREALSGEGIVLRRGKKKFCRAVLK